MKKSENKYCTKCGNPLEIRMIQNCERMYCRYCETVYYENPIPSVSVVARNEKGQLLLVKRKSEPKKGFWALPGGFIEDGESAIQAALREMKEETGLEGIVEKFLKIYNHDSKMYGYVIIITYEVRITGGALEAGDDAEKADFFYPEDLPELAFKFQEDAIQMVTGHSELNKKERVYSNERN